MARGFDVVGVVYLRLAVRLSKTDENKGLFGVYMALEIGTVDPEWFGRH